MQNKHKKFSILASGLVLLVFITGCGDDKTKEAVQAQSKEVQAAKIEVLANENAKEIKVKVKDVDKNQSKSYYYDYNIKSEYDPKSMPANKDASVRVKPRTAIDANLHIRSPYEHVQVALLVQKLSKNFRVKCSACHDDYANGIIGPSLLSRDSDYIFNQIADFKTGKKSNPLMDGLINQMSEEDIRIIADEIYEFNQAIAEMRKEKNNES